MESKLKPIRPNFARPPLQEQAISIVFEPLERFRIVDYGLFWERLAAEFPEVSTDAPLDAPTEQFGAFRPQEMSFQLLTVPPLPRALFRNPDNGRLIQLQSNRFGFNWAKVGDQPYPRSEPLMSRFNELFERFAAFTREKDIGALSLRQCELTNLNVIPVADFGESYSDLQNALRIDPLDLGVPCLKAEVFERARQHQILAADGEPAGRLHMTVAPVISNVDNSQAIRFELTARSAANVETVEQARRFFALARDAINGAFLASVTDRMKEKWGVQDGD